MNMLSTRRSLDLPRRQGMPLPSSSSMRSRRCEEVVLPLRRFFFNCNFHCRITCPEKVKRWCCLCAKFVQRVNTDHSSWKPLNKENNDHHLKMNYLFRLHQSKQTKKAEDKLSCLLPPTFFWHGLITPPPPKSSTFCHIFYQRGN